MLLPLLPLTVTWQVDLPLLCLPENEKRVKCRVTAEKTGGGGWVELDINLVIEPEAQALESYAKPRQSLVVAETVAKRAAMAAAAEMEKLKVVESAATLVVDEKFKGVAEDMLAKEKVVMAELEAEAERASEAVRAAQQRSAEKAAEAAAAEKASPDSSPSAQKPPKRSSGKDSPRGAAKAASGASKAAKPAKPVAKPSTARKVPDSARTKPAAKSTKPKGKA